LACQLVQLPELGRSLKTQPGRHQCRLRSRYRLRRRQCCTEAARQHTRSRLGLVEHCCIEAAHQRTRSMPVRRRCCSIEVARRRTRSRPGLLEHCCIEAAHRRTQSRRLGRRCIEAAHRRTRHMRQSRSLLVEQRLSPGQALELSHTMNNPRMPMESGRYRWHQLP